MFYADYINDPALQKKYSTEAYVKRKDEAKARASKYGNNEVLAEKEFLKEQFLFLQDYTKEKTKQSEEAVTVSTNKKNNVEQDISNGKVNPFQPAYLQKIAQAIEVDEIVYKHNRDLSEEIDPSGNGTIQTNDITSVEGLNLDNLEQARYNVDRLLASYLAEKDIIFAADAYSKNDMIYKKEISPLGLETVRNQNAMARDRENNRRADLRATAKINAASEDARIKYLLENDLAEIDPDTGQIARDPYSGEIILTPTPSQLLEKDEVETDDRSVNMVKHNREVLMENIDNLSSSYVGTWVDSIKNGIALGEIKANDLAYLFGTDRAGGQKIWNKIKNNYDNGADGRQKLVRDLTINAKIFDYKKRMDAWALKNNATSVGQNYNEHSSISSYKLDQMRMFYKVHRDTKEENRKRIANTLSTKLESTGIKDKALRYTIIDQYLKKYVTGETWEDDEFNDVLENIFDSYEKRTGKKASPPGFFERAGKTIKALPSIVGINPGNPAGTLGAISNSFSSSDLLSEMNDEYENIVYQPDHKLGLISYLPSEKGTSGSKTSLGARATSIPVNLGRKDDNLISFNQFLYDLSKINFNQADKNSYMVSLDGNQYDPDAEININLNNKLKNMLFDLKNLSKNKSQKTNPTIFKLIQSQIGAENSDLGAMKISNIPNEVIEKYFKGEDDIIDKIKTNGITYIAPTSNWKNSLFQSNRITPTEAILNTGKKLSYVDPTYGHTVIFDKDNVTGNYRYTTVIRAVDDNGEYFETKESSMAQPFGKQIDNKLNSIMKSFADANARLKEDYERFHNSNNEKNVKAFNEKFGRAPKNPGFNTL
jgi:hypothetical protein